MNLWNIVESELSSLNSLVLPLTTRMFSCDQKQHNYYSSADLEKEEETNKKKWRHGQERGKKRKKVGMMPSSANNMKWAMPQAE